MSSTFRIPVLACAFVLTAHASAPAQGYDPATESPLTLLAAPRDAIVYHEARERARELVTQGKAAEAEHLVEQVVRDYPRDGENWILLGQVKRMLKKYPEAAAAYERAGKLLMWGGPAFSAASAATSHLLAGDKRAALDLLRRHISEEGNMDRSWIYGDEDFVSLRSDPQFLAIAGRPDTTGWSRTMGWRRDLAFLRDEALRLNADYRNNGLPPALERRYEALKEQVPQLSDEEIFVGMNRMLAVLRQGHTGVYASRGSRVAFKGLPFQLWVFPEGIFIVLANEEYRELVGARLVSIEGVAADEALRRVNETQSVDGDNEYLFYGAELLGEVPLLMGLGIATSTDSVRITVEAPDRNQRAITVGTSETRTGTRLKPLPGLPAPMFLREETQLYWDKPLPAHDALYVQFNSIANEPDESLTQYAMRLRRILTDSGPRNLILDMRHNGGGSTNIYAEFLRTLIGFSLLPERRLYVLIGRRTYSAAGNLITELEQLADATFVGEASSECCTFYGSPSPFTLPYSGLRGRMATKRWSLSRNGHDFRRELNPHLPVQLTAADYFSGRDPVLETVLRVIERNARTGGARDDDANG